MTNPPTPTMDRDGLIARLTEAADAHKGSHSGYPGSGWINVVQADVRAALDLITSARSGGGDVVELREALEGALAWDKARGYRMPYRVRDPIYAALSGSNRKGDLPTEQADRAVVDYMVQRFLGWRLPENFSPDNGISFKATFNDHMDPPMRCEPTGTNLFNARQAEAMVRHMLEGLPK